MNSLVYADFPALPNPLPFPSNSTALSRNLIRLNTRTRTLHMRDGVPLNRVVTAAICAGTDVGLLSSAAGHYDAGAVLLARDVQRRVTGEEVGRFDMELVDLTGPVARSQQDNLT